MRGTETTKVCVREERLLKEVPESDITGLWGLAGPPISWTPTFSHALCWTLSTWRARQCLAAGQEDHNKNSESAQCCQGEEPNLCGLKLILGVLGSLMGLVVTAPPTSTLTLSCRATLVHFLSGPSIPGPGIPWLPPKL